MSPLYVGQRVGWEGYSRELTRRKDDRAQGPENNIIPWTIETCHNEGNNFGGAS